MPRGVSRYDEAELQNRLQSVAAFLPWAWWNASDLSRVSVGSSGVTEWRDSSGNGRHMTQTDTAKQPQLVGGALPTAPRHVVRFSGEQMLQRAETVTAGSATIVAVCRATAYRLLGGVWTAGAFGIFNGDGGDASYVIDGFGANAGSSSNTSAKLNQWGVVTGEYASASTNSSEIAFNGLIEESFPATGGVNATQSGHGLHQLGGRTLAGIANRTLQGEIAEVAVFFPRLPARDKAIIEGIMAWRAGIALTGAHPFANRPPLIGD